jgi:CHAD domain-containing protein
MPTRRHISATTQPVHALREQATALEAALEVCAADPRKDAVHALRTGTRRLEAQIELLGMARGLPSHQPPAEAFLKRLAKLRRHAGRVRDLDVHKHLLKKELPPLLAALPERRALKKDVARMYEDLRRRRRRRAHKLQTQLRGEQTKVTAALEALMQALEPAEERDFSAATLLDHVRQNVQRKIEAEHRHPGEETLHELRKSAKRARYQAEAVGSAAGEAAARRYERLQDAGGAWHDLLDLGRIACEELGTHHALVEVLAQACSAKLDVYTDLLEEESGAQSRRKAA